MSQITLLHLFIGSHNKCKRFFLAIICALIGHHIMFIFNGIFFIESSSVNKKNVILCFLGLLRGENTFFCGLKSAPWVIKTPGARVFALVLRHAEPTFVNEV